MSRYHDRMRNGDIHKRTNIKEIAAGAMHAKCSWRGHVTRLDVPTHTAQCGNPGQALRVLEDKGNDGVMMSLIVKWEARGIEQQTKDKSGGKS